jgi:hypothetical protein
MPEPVSSRRASRPLVGLVIVGASLSVWWPAFVLGAYGTLFFDQSLTVWVASVAALVVLLLQPRPSPHRLRRVLALLIPSLWLALAFVPARAGGLVEVVVAFLAAIAALVGLPFAIWVLATILWPGFGKDVSRKTALLAVAAVVLIAAGSFALGANHSHFLTCEDFALSGNAHPPGCVPASKAG